MDEWSRNWGSPRGFIPARGRGREETLPVNSNEDGDGEFSPRGDGDGGLIPDGDIPVAIPIGA
jgi:hypothetical protein